MEQLTGCEISCQVDQDVIANMRGRAARCRRLAGGILNRADSEMLLKMAEEIEADIEKLEKRLG